MPHERREVLQSASQRLKILQPSLGRREFIALAGAALGSVLSEMPIMAGPFEPTDWNSVIPADKKLHPDWVESLFARGEPTIYTKARGELGYIGMPIGGICCGTLYLSGDGRLWNWDIFNQKIEGILPRFVKWSEIGMNFETGNSSIRPRDGATFVKPAVFTDSPAIAQGFAIKITSPAGSDTRSLDASGWADVSFRGQYPIGTVEYYDPDCPVGVKLEAFSPFIPHHADDSGLPATIFEYTVSNRGTQPVSVDLAGWLQNATCFYSAKAGSGSRVNRALVQDALTMVAMEFQPPQPADQPARDDILIDGFEHGYAQWTATGEAFGNGPVARQDVPDYQGELSGLGDYVANSHASAPGNDVGAKDGQTGKLTSAPFLIQRKYLQFFVGGGSREDVGVRLLVDGQVVRTSRGTDANRMRREAWDVAELEGRQATIEIYDDAAGPWANVGADEFILTDRPQLEVPLHKQTDFGTMALAVVGKGTARPTCDTAHLPASGFATEVVDESAPQESAVPTAAAPSESPVGVVSQRLELQPGQTKTATFIVAWHFRHTTLPCPDAASGNYYAQRFPNAAEVIQYVTRELSRLTTLTRLWRDTWYDSTLPQWFLERTFANTSILATTTAHRFGTGRFWAWEGIGCCEGTCTHVWHYAQAMGRLFPELERDLRERVDFGVGFIAEQGIVRHRAEGTGPAIDGQCGRILGVWREHQMSADSAFLQRVWPNVKRALDHVIAHDTNGDGILDGAQENTLDAAWYGQIAWITSLSIAALRAGEKMALELGDASFAQRCRRQADIARQSLESKLYNGEYFIQIADPEREKSLGTYEACHIDQVHGQSWAWQVDLGRILDRDKTLSALRALWKYNFAPDVGPFRQKYTAGRPYALAGDGGLVMTTNPKLIPDVFGISSWQIGYFNECMSGFEHQVASHMMAEGMTLEALAITRAVHDRYHALKRNPFNEIECSDHYARAMASYGTLISACGFVSHGPAAHLGFAPRLTPELFRAPFTVAGGWGSYTQTRNDRLMHATLELKHGQTRLKTLSLEVSAADAQPYPQVTDIKVTLGSDSRPAKFTQVDNRVTIEWPEALILSPDKPLHIDVNLGLRRE